MLETFVEISLVIIITVLLAGLMRLLKQPLIIAYILAGIIASPALLNIVPSSASLETFASFGIVLLLFMVGLNLNPKVVKDVGLASLAIGLGQVLFTAIIGYWIGRWAGFDAVTSWYVAIALTFSSTIIITKLLSDKGELDTLHGRLSIGFLLVQDLVAIVALMVISAVSGNALSSGTAVQSLLVGALLLVGLALMSAFILPRLSRAVARSQELLLLASLGWCFLLAVLFHSLNFSMEIGALLAGISLSMSPYKYEISSKLRPLRDFFIFLFFIMLGTQMSFVNTGNYVVPIIIFSVFVLLGNPMIMYFLLSMLGYTKRTSFQVGLIGAQISEFSLIMIALGVSVGHLQPDILSFVTAVGLITIAGSSYFILYSDRLYRVFAPLLSLAGRDGSKADARDSSISYDTLLLGYNRIGYDLLEAFKKLQQRVLVVDFNPDVIAGLSKRGVPCTYGDAGDTDLLESLCLSQAKMVVSTIPDLETNLLVAKKLRSCNKKAIILVVSHHIEDALKLYGAGVSYVVMPHFLGGKHTAMLLEEYGLDLRKFLREKIVHLHDLKKRKELGHHHPVHEW